MAEENVEILTRHVDEVVCNHCGAVLDVSAVDPFTRIACAQCQKELSVPAQLANFVLVDRLGQGGMGCVFKGFDQQLKRPVAIKVMKKSLGENTAFVEQFLREARSLAALNNPHVVQIYNYGEELGQPYIVMELVDGGRLDLLQKKHGALDETFVLHTAIDVVKGLHAAHEAGLTHGDIKPANVLFDREKKAKVVDFGLARFQGEKPSPGEIWGTPFYVAPEVVRGKQPDQKADIYSLGATLYHLLANCPPFNENTVQETVIARFKNPPPSLASVRPDLHPGTISLIERMLTVDPFMRYPNYDSLLADLRAAMTDVKGGPAPQPHKKSHAVAITFSILAVAALAGGGFWLVRSKKAPPPPPPTPSKNVVMKLVDGKLVPVAAGTATAPATPVPVATATPTSPAAPAATPKVTASGISLTTAIGQGADAYIQGTDDAKNPIVDDIIWIKAGANANMNTARKAYLRFDLRGLDLNRLTDAFLTLTAAPSSKNKKDGRYELMLWGIKDEASVMQWAERIGQVDAPLLSWFGAPGNNIDSAGGMSDQADLLAVVPVKANYSPGETVAFSNAHSTRPNAIRDYLQVRSGKTATFIITANDASDQRAGWKFAAKENNAFAPPTLFLRGAEIKQ